MTNYKKYWGFMLLCFLFTWTSLFAQAPQTIRVGLESAYKDKAQIQLNTESRMAIGYWEGNRFLEEGSIYTSSITVQSVKGSYYSYNVYYNTYEEALDALWSYGSDAVIAYTPEGDYAIYTPYVSNDVVPVMLGVGAYEVYDDAKQMVLICDNTTRPIVFQGQYSQYSFPVTGVGNDRKYRGVIEIVKGQGSGLTAVSVVDMEEYLYSVVGGEMVPSWHQEALKAQAVASRGIATYQYNRHLSKGYNVVDTTLTQVYKGLSTEYPSTIAAVEATRGEIATYNGKTAETLYYSTSGGYTEDPVYVWGTTVPYLKAVPDTYEVEPEMKPWTRTITLAEVQKCVTAKGANIGEVIGVKIVSRTPSGRVNQMDILGTSGTYTVKNEDVRTFFSSSKEGSLRSRMFQWTPYSGQGSNQTPSTGNQLTIVSSSGQTTVTPETVKVLDEGAIVDAPELLFVQTATGTTILEAQESSGNNVQQENSVVYGDLTIYGKGFGHGVGMSQSGAKGMANAGFTYDEIINHYYPGVVIE